jgi:hypothetical protein
LIVLVRGRTRQVSINRGGKMGNNKVVRVTGGMGGLGEVIAGE